MPGLGKTTLAKKVYNSVFGSFECSAWIYVSQTPNVEELSRQIAREVHFLEEDSSSSFEAQLFAFLSQKRYVIVLDDIWENKPWEALKRVIPDPGKKGSRIIITSRNKHVGIQVGGVRSVHELHPLDEENSRSLFFKELSRHQETEDEREDLSQLENVIMLILKRCGGVPLAIVLIAGVLLLREKTDRAWRGVLKSMGQEEDECSKIFALSYRDLHPTLKPCFLYFGLFPEDYEVSVFELINLWAAEGYIQKSDGQEVEQVGEDRLNHLIARNLVQVVQRRSDGRIKSCQIHDILHDICVKEAKKIYFSSSYNDIATNYSAIGARRLTINESNICDPISSSYSSPKLRAMLWFGRENYGNFDDTHLKKKQVTKLIGDSRLIRVLRLEVNFDKISLPRQICSLRHLSYIQLEASFHVELPYAICNMRSLLTLDIRECESLTIPDCIWKMEQLRQFLIPFWSEIKFSSVGLPLGLGNFCPIKVSTPNLQTLYGWDVKHLPANLLTESTNLRKLGVYFELDQFLRLKVLLDAMVIPNNLEILKLVTTDEPVDLLSLNICVCENLLRMHLGGPVTGLPEPHKFPPNLTKLTLLGTRLENDPMEVLKRLPKLKVLKLGYFSYLGEEMVCSEGPGNFTQLETLEIQWQPCFKKFIVENEAMPRLNKLRLYHTERDFLNVPDRIRNLVTSGSRLTQIKLKFHPRSGGDLERAMTKTAYDFKGVKNVELNRMDHQIIITGVALDAVPLVVRIRKITFAELLSVVLLE